MKVFNSEGTQCPDGNNYLKGFFSEGIHFWRESLLKFFWRDFFSWRNSFLISGVEDDEKIVDSIKEPGELQAKFIGLAFMDGTVKIDVEPSIVGDVSILMGGTKFFEHYLLNKMQCILKVPNGNFF